MNRKITRHIGNSLIILSLGVFVFLGYPILKTYLFPAPFSVNGQPAEQFTLSIPKIRAQAPVIEQVSPWNESEYRSALKKGIAHAEYTGLPGDGKTVFLFAHSSGMPWEQVYYNTIFLRLGELSQGDEIIIDRKKKRFVYRVTEKKEVWPNEVNYLLNTNKNELILQTCTPIGTSLRRLLIFAKPVNNALLQSENEH